MKEEKEIWKPVRNYEGLYEVSNLGRVKSLERTVWCGLNGGCYRTVSEKILKAVINGSGYLKVQLWKDGKRRQCLVHRLVAAVFCENPEGYTEVNHINEIKSDNRAENLEYCSRSYNMTYNGRAERVGKKLRGRKQTEEHIKKRVEKLSKPVFSVNKESGLITYWESIKEAEKCTGIHHGDITRCCKGKRNSTGGCIWFYADDDNE